MNCETNIWAQQPDNNREEDPFVLVVNEGSAEFSHLDLGRHARRVDFRKVAEAVIDRAKKEDRLRGNFQLNLMFSGGENQRRGVVEIADHYGCAMPGLNVDSEKWIYLAVEMSLIARKVAIPWVVNPDENLQERNQIFAQKLHKDNVFEGVTIALLELFPNPGMVNEHVDGLNCFVYTHTLLFSEIVNLAGKIYRVLLIGYMRKTCFDSMIRRRACEELAGACSSYMEKSNLSQRPGMTPASYKPFYDDMGSMGLGVMVERSTETGLLKIRYAALLHPPHVNKALSYLSPVATSIWKVYQKHRTLSYIDLLSMCLPVAHLCGFYSYLSVLDTLSEVERLDSDPETGLLERIMTDLVDLVGCYSGGGFRRHQCSFNCHTGDRRQLASELLVLRGMCLKSTETPPKGRSYEQHCQERYSRYLETVKGSIKGAGDLTGTHLITVLVQVGVLKPVGMVHCSHFATATCLFKSRAGVSVKNPNAQAYINSRSALAKGSNNALKSQRAQRLMESVLPHLRLKFPFMERSFIEQINCETYRRDAVFDFYGPGMKHVFVHPLAPSHVHGLHVLTPELNLNTGLISVVASLQSRDTGRVTPPSIVRYREGAGISLCGSYGKDSKPTTPVRIPMEYIDSFPGLRRELMSHFFVTVDSKNRRCVPTTKTATKWIASHPILSKLLRQFFTYPLPKPVPSASLRAESFQTVRQRKGFKSPQQLFFDYTAAKSSMGTQLTDITKQGNMERSDDDGHNTELVAALTSVSTTTAQLSSSGTHSDLCPSPKRQRLCNVPKQDVPLPTASASIQIPDFLFSDSVDIVTGCNKPVSIYDNIIFKSYKVHGDKGLDLVCKNRSGMPVLKRLLLRPSAVLTLSPLHAEVKQCVYHGMKSSAMPTVFSKGCFIAVKCTTASHVFKVHKPLPKTSAEGKEPALYMSRLFGYEQCHFYTVGFCSLIDKLAVSMGAKAAHSRTDAGVVNWLFDTVDASNKFFVQATMISSGKPSYFRSLYYRMIKLIRGGATIGVDIGQVVVHLCLPGNNGCLFYAILQPPHGKHNDSWCLVPVPSVTTTAQDLLYIDCWSWKSHDELQLSPTQSSAGEKETLYSI